MLQWSFFLNERVLIASLIGTSAAETGEEIGFFSRTSTLWHIVMMTMSLGIPSEVSCNDANSETAAGDIMETHMCFVLAAMAGGSRYCDSGC